MRSAGRVYIVGDRRIGKTSLIFEAARRLTDIRIVYADLMAIKSVADLSQRLAQAVIRAENQESRILTLLKSLAALRPTISVDPTTNLPTVGFAPGSGGQPETLDSIFALLSSWDDPVVVLDEFQDILAVPAEEAAVAHLRGLVQQQEKAAFVFCGSVRGRMEEIFTDRGSPFFHAAMRLHVGPIERRTFRRFLERKFEAAERRLESGVVDAILDVCHDNPGDAQRFCTACGR
jgi:AAA+ ATPase superfamily predicted ATPase